MGILLFSGHEFKIPARPFSLEPADRVVVLVQNTKRPANGKEFLFEGSVDGEILTEKHGDAGFGYDPIFRADGFDQSFAELSLNEKNKITIF